ncbi:hypothetical protein O0L34_g7898 [Tuta absoluta]|nr:hypothetical protein O0L34_g7898 [Tuta absoluta]
MQTKLKAATKHKIAVERQVYKLNNTERTLYEELHLLRAEIDNLTEQLEDLKDKISTDSYDIASKEIQKAAEQSKMDVLIAELHNHRNAFSTMFAEERKISELRNKELQAKAAEEDEMERQKQQEKHRQVELQATEAATVEDEASAIEQECAVLKKRNHAIMLKLRRKLVQTEDTRRELLNQQQGNQ